MTIDEIIQHLNIQLRKELKVFRNQGGSHGLSHCILADERDWKFFLKYTSSDDPEKLKQVSSEAMALRHFKELNVRTPLYVGRKDFPGILLLFIEGKHKSQSDLAQQVSRLHGNHESTYGLNYNNYIASIPLDNSRCEKWSEFYWFQRIKPLLQVAINNNNLPASYLYSEDTFIQAIEKKVPIEAPTLIHGDLWAGNYLVDIHKKSYLIDPAMYYGHREMDIAMSKLFGGFNGDFYAEYNQRYPLEAGWGNRLPYHQLYYLLVHVVLFGGSYSKQAINAWNATLN